MFKTTKIYVIAEVLRWFHKTSFINYANQIILNALRHKIILYNQLYELNDSRIKDFENYIKDQLEQYDQVTFDIKKDEISAQLIIILDEESPFIAIAVHESTKTTDIRLLLLLLLDLCSEYTVYKIFSAKESIELKYIIKKVYQDLYSSSV